MNKRKFIKTIIAGSLLRIWLPPVVTAIPLPAHAHMSCNDIQWRPGFPPVAAICFSNEMSVIIQIVLVSNTQSDENNSFAGEVLDVFSDNPAHQVTWRLSGLDILNIDVRESAPQGCIDGEIISIHQTNFSPSQLFIETSCGTLTIPFSV